MEVLNQNLKLKNQVHPKIQLVHLEPQMEMLNLRNLKLPMMKNQLINKILNKHHKAYKMEKNRQIRSLNRMIVHKMALTMENIKMVMNKIPQHNLDLNKIKIQNHLKKLALDLKILKSKQVIQMNRPQLQMNWNLNQRRILMMFRKIRMELVIYLI